MRAHTGLPVDDDVLDRILTFSPSFPSLFAFAGACRATHAVFTRRRASTLRAVAHNVCGPAWPVALRAVRANAAEADMPERIEQAIEALREARRAEIAEQAAHSQAHSRANSQATTGSHGSDTEDDDDHDEDEDDEDDDDEGEDDEDAIDAVNNFTPWMLPEIPSENELHAAVIAPEELRDLQRMGDDVAILEVAFSQRFINMAVPENVLSAEESLRLQRGLYRLETFGALFGRPLRSRYQPLSDHDRKRHEEDMLAFLLPLPDSELFELQEISLFINDILYWGSRASHLYHHHGLTINSVASHIHDASELLMGRASATKGVVYGWPWIGCDFLSETLERIREHRKIENRDWVPMEVHRAIATPTSNLCNHCNTYSGPRLYSAASWDFLRGDLLANELEFPRHLLANTSFGASLRQAISQSGFLNAALMSNLFDCDEEDNGGGGWARDQHLCLDCVKAFVKEHIVSWWRRSLALSGKPVPLDNCWYGWNCRTQTHKPAHAEKLNHLCVPTRGAANV